MLYSYTNIRMLMSSYMLLIYMAIIAVQDTFSDLWWIRHQFINNTKVRIERTFTVRECKWEIIVLPQEHMLCRFFGCVGGKVFFEMRK